MDKTFAEWKAALQSWGGGPRDPIWSKYNELVAEWKALDGLASGTRIVELLEIKQGRNFQSGTLAGQIRAITHKGTRLDRTLALRAIRAIGSWDCMPPYAVVLRLLRGVELDEELQLALGEFEALKRRFWLSPGKIRELDRQIESLRSGGARQPLIARGPWSTTVLTAVAGEAQWLALVDHWRDVSDGVPSRKWKDRAVVLMEPVGKEAFVERATAWLEMEPTSGDDGDLQRGLLWCAGLTGDARMAAVLGDFAVACFRKIPDVGAVSHKLGNAAVRSLGEMPGMMAIAQLNRLAGRVKYNVARRLIEKELAEAAERNGVSRELIEAMSVPRVGLDENGMRTQEGDGWQGRLSTWTEGAMLEWTRDGKRVKAAPPEGLELKKAKKELDGLLAAQRRRLEGMLLSGSVMTGMQLRTWYLEHPVVRVDAARLIWEVDGVPLIAWNGAMVDAAGNAVALRDEACVRLWHPVEASEQMVRSWRSWLEDHPVRQPFQQAHRAVYQLADTAKFSSRILRQHPFSALCWERGWQYKLMGNFDGHMNAMRPLVNLGLHAELEIEMLEENHESKLGIYLEVRTGELRFLRGRNAVPIEEVPVRAFSEVARDVDLFLSVSNPVE